VHRLTNTTESNRILPGYELKDELARFCLPAASRNPDRKLAWMSSICILVLLIGIMGDKQGSTVIQPLPPAEDVISTVIEPVTLPPEIKLVSANQEQTDESNNDTPQVVVVTPESPSINFAVPTIGNVMVPAGVAQAPPLKPMEAPAPVKTLPSALRATGTGGQRPQPPYPKIALEQGEQGTVQLLMSADEAGNIIAIEIKESSGFPVLDRSTLDFVKRHWKLPPGAGVRRFETSIIYRLEVN
jgi:TonB family protein